MFERIQRITAFERYKLNHPEVSDTEARTAVKTEKFVGGIKLTPKDLRDYFASVMKDPLVASKMLGHTNLRTDGYLPSAAPEGYQHSILFPMMRQSIGGIGRGC